MSELFITNKEVRDYSEFEETLDINELCKYEKQYSNELEKGGSCKDCEFCMSIPIGCIGGMDGMTMGNKLYCEKGYWTEDV